MDHNPEQLPPSTDEPLDTGQEYEETPTEVTDQEYEETPTEPTDQEIATLVKTSLEKKSNLEDAPDGWLRISEIADQRLDDKVSVATVKRTVKRLNIVGKKFRGRGENKQRTTFYSPDDINRIINDKEVQRLYSLEDAPDDWKCVSEITTQRLDGKVDQTTVNKVVRELSIKGKEFRSREGTGQQGITFYSPKDIEEIVKNEIIQRLYSLEDAPDNWECASEIATQQLDGKVAQTTVKNIAEVLGIIGKKFRGRDNNKLETTFYSPKDIKKIVNNERIQELYSLEDAPDDWKNAYEIAAQRLDGKVSHTKVANVAKKLKIEGKTFRSRDGSNKPPTFYSPDDIKTIINDKTIQELYCLEYPPENWKCASEIAAERLDGKVTQQTVGRIAKKLGIKGKEFRGRDHNMLKTIFYHPADIGRIVNDEETQRLYSLEDPLENWKCASEIAVERLDSKVTQSTVRNVAKKLGIKGEEFRSREKRGQQVVTFYSPEEIDQIIEGVENSTTSASFPEKAIAFYLQQAGVDIKQNHRPDWMKNPSTNRNLEIDIFIPFDNPPPPGIGIEYDGAFWHKNPDYDAKKNSLSRKEGIEIIHIRESGCPDLPVPDDGQTIPCIYRQDNKGDTSLTECIKQVLSEFIGIQLPEQFIDVYRDQAVIFKFMGVEEEANKNTENTSENELHDGDITEYNTNKTEPQAA